MSTTSHAAPPSAGPIPIVHSVVDAAALGAIIRRRHALPEPFECELLTRGVNDVYVVKAPGHQYAARVWRAHLRSNTEVAFELEFLLHLKRQGLPVVAPVVAPDGAAFFVVEAPEGPRQVCLFAWASGSSFAHVADPETGERIGAVMAEIHLAAQRFQGPAPRPIDYQQTIRKSMPIVLKRLAERPDDLTFYQRAAAAVVAALDQPAVRALPRGAIHGDIHARNVFVDGNRTLQVLAFDAAGEAPLLQDVRASCGPPPISPSIPPAAV